MSEVAFGSLLSEPLRNGVSYPSRTRGEGVRMVNMREIFAHDRITADVDCELVPLTRSERETSILTRGDLLFARQSLTYEGAGKVSLVLDDSGPTWDSHLIRARVDPGRANPTYFYYFFRSAEGRRRVETIIQQVAAAGIRGSELARLSVPAPTLPEQEAIAEVLGALDDKIAANTAFSATVDLYLASYLSRLVGENPEERLLSDVAVVNRASVKPSAEGQLRYVDIASVGVGAFDYPGLMSWSEAPGRARRKIGRGDTMWSTVRPNRRSHALNLSDDPLLVASTGLAVLTPTTVGFAFLYEATRRPSFSAYLENVAEGSAYPAVRSDRFLGAPIPAASPESIGAFESLAAPLREAVFAASEENRTLAATRDALLPQLMSGKLRVRDAEELAAQAGA